MTFEIAAFMTLFVIALLLFALEWFSADVTALGLMIAMVLLGLLTPQEAFAGFGSDTVMMIFGLLILTESLVHTGLVDVVGRSLIRIVGTSRMRIQSIVLIAPPLMSSIISNTASSAFFLPIVQGLAHRTRISPSKLLMPMAVAAVLAGAVTLIGTSTNLIISGLLQQYGLAPLSMFELTPIGLPILLVGLVYMGTIGQRLIPDRSTQSENKRGVDNDLYFTEIRVPASSSLIGKTIDKSGLIHTLQLGMLSLQRADESYKPLAETAIEAHDILLVEGSRETMLNLPDFMGIEISGTIQQLEDYIKNGTARIAEVIILPGSPLIGRTIKGLGLRDRYQLQILAVNQAGAIRHSRIGRLTLNIGDVLLIKIPRKNLESLENERMFRILDIIENKVIDTKRVVLATGIFAGSLSLAITGILPISVAVLLGAFLAFVTRCITPDIAYRNIQWKTIILISSMLAFGRAMQVTGTADYLASLISNIPASGSPLALLSIFFFIALVLTQPMSSQAAAAIVLPIAIQTALVLGYNPRPFAIIVALAASCSFITPLEPACMIVYSAGRYKFMDFVRVGGLLTLIVYVIAIALIPLIWHL